MSKKFNTSKLSKQELASHLKKPTGEDGKEVGRQMNKGNKHICLNSYNVLNPKSNSLILEIGMGNGYFTKNILSMNPNLECTGLDFSQTMVDEAMLLNKKLINTKKVSFIKGSIEKLPFDNNSFDYITTTNTIYFWPNLIDSAKEMYRVLKPTGKALIGYRSKELMDKIELTQYNFNKYTKEEIEKLLDKTGFKQIATEVISEPDIDFDGIPMSMSGLFTYGLK
ncbi:class I SAM-dependent methyltransferase [uncultured Algibacter sp.]|uniref:class I SAM-dependent methyltransferase n=1 Tax=uncultured Algibacter sp. TaxID=298659 RepID=UPI00261C3B2D|nr:class I SAM-dependent methyltransferase [uncultured Algibacter sp.]